MPRLLPTIPLLTVPVLWSAAAAAAPFDYDALVATIKDHQVTSIEQLLPLLPQGFRASYGLMHTSGSLQEASAQNPRAILFGDDAQLTCAFNGDQTQEGFDTLECFQFHKATASFDFRAIDFPSPRNHLTRVAFSASNRSADGSVDCTSCHGADPRPNWSTYSQWPGAYGASDDFVRDMAGAYAAYVATRPAHPRYRWLVQDADASAPYMDSGAYSMARRPNLRFSDFMGRMNGLRTARLMAARLKPCETLGFAAVALDCRLSAAQEQAITAAGHALPANGVDAYYPRLGIPAQEWTMRPDASGGENNYEHQSGFNFLSMDTAMGTVVKLADAGDTALRDALTAMTDGLSADRTGDELPFFRAMAAILPDPDYFGGNRSANEQRMCPSLTAHVVEACLADHD